MREAMSSANLTLPIFESDRAKDEFTVRLLVHHLLGPEDVAWLAQFKECDLSPDEAKALLVVREMGAIDNSVYRDINRVDTLTASAALRHLRDLHLLEKRGKGSAIYYVPTGNLSGRSTVRESLTSGAESGAQAPGLQAQSNAANSGDKSQSPEFREEPEGSISRDKAQSPELPRELAEMVRLLGERAGPPEVKQAILRLCAWRPLPPSEIARFLNRSAEYLRKQYLGPMREVGRRTSKSRSPHTRRGRADAHSQRPQPDLMADRGRTGRGRDS